MSSPIREQPPLCLMEQCVQRMGQGLCPWLGCYSALGFPGSLSKRECQRAVSCFETTRRGLRSLTDLFGKGFASPPHGMICRAHLKILLIPQYVPSPIWYLLTCSVPQHWPLLPASMALMEFPGTAPGLSCLQTPS